MRRTDEPGWHKTKTDDRVLLGLPANTRRRLMPPWRPSARIRDRSSSTSTRPVPAQFQRGFHRLCLALAAGVAVAAVLDVLKDGADMTGFHGPLLDGEGLRFHWRSLNWPESDSAR
jgi:hypothetical protein